MAAFLSNIALHPLANRRSNASRFILSTSSSSPSQLNSSSFVTTTGTKLCTVPKQTQSQSYQRHNRHQNVRMVANAPSTTDSSSSSSPSSSTDGNVIVSGSDDLALMDSVHLRKAKVEGEPVAIVVLGASGDLAKKKTFPAIFSLYYHDLLPANFVLVGFARSELSDEEFRNIILMTLSCRVIDGKKCSQKMDEFLPRCFYHRGSYNQSETFVALSNHIDDLFQSKFSISNDTVNRLFYLAVPPKVFSSAVNCINSHSRASDDRWTRVVVEKPFGHDLQSYQVLKSSISNVLTEDETFRIDHFLAKELVQNLMTLRFANSIFEPLWNKHYIHSVQLTFKENFGVEGRAGYFDSVGIVRDIMQNHLLQMLSLLAMEQPISLSAEDIRDEKVKVLKSMQPLSKDNFVTGQYTAKDEDSKGYLEDDGVPSDSLTPTFAACAIHINNPRWDGVPFFMRAGKALDERKTEIRIQFKHVPGALFPAIPGSEHNELVIRVQPDEAIYVRIMSKVPGITSRMEEARLNLFYRHAWEESKDIPDAYERLILDVIQGEKSLFIRDDELEVSWRIFTPALNELEGESGPKPELYRYGSTGPENAHELAKKYGVTWSD